MYLERALAKELVIKSPKALGVSKVFRTEKADPFYKGKTIWGPGMYFSASKADCEKINDGGVINSITLPSDFRLIEFDLTWADSERSDNDYPALHALIGEHPVGVNGLLIRSNSLQYGFSQVLIFPKSIKLLKG